MTEKSLHTNASVRDRYSAAAQEREAALCCPVSYDPAYLKAIPQEVLDRDYGCGDPSKYVQAGDVVLDLGSGGGKICFIAAQVVGSTGRVIGVDCNDEMLSLARRSQAAFVQRVGYDNIEFRKGQIQDLKLDLDRFERRLREAPVETSSGWLQMQEHAEELRTSEPLIADDSVTVVVSNCVLNLVHQADRNQLFREIHRVLKPGGRAVISDIVSDADVPGTLQNDPTLWSGCVSGAFREDRFLAAFEAAGFGGIEIIERSAAPWQVVAGIEFRSVTVRAYKLPVDCCNDGDRPADRTVMYRGPWKSVSDDRGATYLRGEWTRVSSLSAQTFALSAYSGQMLFVDDKTESGQANSCCSTSPVQPFGFQILPLSEETSCCTPSERTGVAQSCCSK